MPGGVPKYKHSTQHPKTTKLVSYYLEGQSIWIYPY